MFLIFCLVIGSLGHWYVSAQAQRIAPGVPPQHYQQQHNAGQQGHQQIPQQQIHNQHPQQQQYQQQQQQQQQHQQQQLHHQQPPQQLPQQQQHQQQVPVQPPVHVPVQQQPGHAHDHGHVRNPQQLLNTANMEQEKAHIAEHSSVPIDTSKMTDQELQFHYFKMHDADNNNMLDGCELIKSLIHWHEQGNNDPNGEHGGHKLFTDDELQSLIDPILDMDDRSKDGYIDYPEFIQAQQKAAATGQQ